MSSFGAVLDACVLYPYYLRDTILFTARAGLYRPQLTEDILEEVRRNHVKNNIPKPKSLQEMVDKVRSIFPASIVTHHRPLIPSMPINEKDRHVLAAAVASDAQVIVTKNLKDFPPHLLKPFYVEAQSPDDFLMSLFYLSPERMINALTKQAGQYSKRPKTVLELLDTLNQHAPKFVDLVQQHILNDEDVQFWL